MKTAIELAQKAGFGKYAYEAKSMFESLVELVRDERSALAEQPAPVAKPHEQEPCKHERANDDALFGSVHSFCKHCHKEWTNEMLAERQPGQEPVAWMHTDGQERSADTWVVPDFLTAHDPETPEYRNGWNDYRQLMMEMYRREIK